MTNCDLNERKVLLGMCHASVEKEMRDNLRVFLWINYRRLCRGNFRMVGLSVSGLLSHWFKRG
jgi:hypothetical protein